MSAKKTDPDTPLMRQYSDMKKKFPDALLLFRVGDFYETFSDDAIKASSILGITLTSKSVGNAARTELAGFPYHAIEQYLPRLVRAGLRVAICEQVEDPKKAKGLVKRSITELVTPGVSYNDLVLDVKENNFLCGLHLTGGLCGVAFLDVSTGEFYVAQGNLDYIEKLIQSMKPTEVIIQRKKMEQFRKMFQNQYYVNSFDDWVFTSDYAEDVLLKQFDTVSLKGFGVENMTEGIIAAGAAMHYLQETRHDMTQHICKLTRIEEDKYVWLDKFTIRNLELVSPPNSNTQSLQTVIDRTQTPMGGRLLRRWILMPLKQKSLIEERQNIVKVLVNDEQLLDELRQHIAHIGDLERLISKASVRRINPRELLQLRKSLLEVDAVRSICIDRQLHEFDILCEQLNPCKTICDRIVREIAPDAPVRVDKGGTIAAGVNAELDDLRNLSTNSKDYLKRLQQQESERTGISSLKIGYNNVFGYYLEVTNTHKSKVPQEWVRRQTLANAERYITPELKDYEQRILTAEERISEIENQLYDQLLSTVIEYVNPIQYNAAIIAKIDCLQSFAVVAKERNYCCPTIVDESMIDIVEGRHPVIEAMLPVGEQYISNNTFLDTQTQQIVIITGPNMSGKSALLRQTALIVLLAQIGAYCPAESVKLGVVDKIFTRVGASDNITSGESTFMVEMNETASILNNVSGNSLVLLDEIGRGTSTYDGISIAWAITEYLHNLQNIHPKVMFATHYHELIVMEQSYQRIKNYHVSVKEVGNKVIFLRKLKPGGSEHSFGIHVARMAGMPKKVLTRAMAMLEQLEDKSQSIDLKGNVKSRKNVAPNDDANPCQGYQLSFIQLDDPTLTDIRDRILDIDIDSLTPIQALLKLDEIKKIVSKK